ncbi:MAG: hypothetical protein GHCLOJNM_02907 [bacterium]|nr:hypothetical protein [bacterium]
MPYLIAEAWGFNRSETKRYTGASWAGVSGDIRFEYTYDANGNLTGVKKETKSGSTWSQIERWAYTWTPRDQMRYATKYNAADAFSGRVEYKYCLSCDGALSERIEYNPSWTVVSHRRYEYDGLNLVRLDERYDADTPPDGGSSLEPQPHPLPLLNRPPIVPLHRAVHRR